MIKVVPKAATGNEYDHRRCSSKVVVVADPLAGYDGHPIAAVEI